MVDVIALERMLTSCRWPGCKAEPLERQIPLCDRHFQYVGERFVEERTILGASFARASRPSIEERQEQMRARDEERARLLEEQSVVYYVRIGDHVKIGYTVNLKQRLSALRVNTDAVLATEPGGRLLENRRHTEFAGERVGKREDFNPSRRLLAHIADVRARCGEPVVTTYPKIS